jgi:thioredoxin-like negative regulator of GroEL
MALVEPALLERMSLGSDARLCAAEAMLALGQTEQATRLLEKEEPLLRQRGDRHRLRRLRDVRARRHSSADAAGHMRLAERALREGQREVALEHYRAARILRESVPEPGASAEPEAPSEEG